MHINELRNAVWQSNMEQEAQAEIDEILQDRLASCPSERDVDGADVSVLVDQD